MDLLTAVLGALPVLTFGYLFNRPQPSSAVSLGVAIAAAVIGSASYLGAGGGWPLSSPDAVIFSLLRYWVYIGLVCAVTYQIVPDMKCDFCLHINFRRLH